MLLRPDSLQVIANQFASENAAALVVCNGLISSTFSLSPEGTIMEKTKETFVAWLRDAYAMEQKAIDTLENQDKRLEHYPELHGRIRQHLEESRQQAEMIKGCLKRYDADTSALKGGFAKFMGNTEALFNSAAGDEVVKNSLSNYAFEHFEIASYKSLIATAEMLGDHKTKQVCETILKQEEEMARWLDEHLSNVTTRFLELDLSPEEAKR